MLGAARRNAFTFKKGGMLKAPIDVAGAESVAANRVTEMSRIRGTRRTRKETEGHDAGRN